MHFSVLVLPDFFVQATIEGFARKCYFIHPSKSYIFFLVQYEFRFCRSHLFCSKTNFCSRHVVIFLAQCSHHALCICVWISINTTILLRNRCRVIYAAEHICLRWYSAAFCFVLCFKVTAYIWLSTTTLQYFSKTSRSNLMFQQY